MTETRQRARPEAAAPTWETILQRNPVERAKQEKFPLEIIHEFEAMARTGYQAIGEDDLLRLRWYGLYHDKPKVGRFMLRIKIPNGILTARQYRAIGALSRRYGANYSELTTRQCVQLHDLQVEHFPEIFSQLDQVGLTTVAACGDTVRNVTGCPVAGLDPDELFDCRPQAEAIVAYFLRERAYFNLPRKHKLTVSACAYQCNAPAIQDIAFVGARQAGPDGERFGFSLRVGGGLSSTPRLGRDLGVFVKLDEALPVARALTDLWREDLRYRRSRARARLKFLVDDYGPEQVRAAIERRLGYSLADLVEPPRPLGQTDHLGIHRQKQDGRYYLGFPVPQGLVSGEQAIQLGELVESVGGDIRLTRQQNFIVTGVPEAQVEAVVAQVAAIGFPLDVNRLRGTSVACTGQPLCVYAVAATKPKLGEIVERLEARFGRALEGLTLSIDGCPHACGHHWVMDIGLQGTTARADDNGKLEAYEIYLRGGLDEPAPALGQPLLRRVPAALAPVYLERLVGAWLAERQGGETFQAFSQRQSDDELVAIATGGLIALQEVG